MESVFFFPIILPMAIVAIVWGMLLNTDMGVINGLLTTVGLGKVPWLTDPRFSLMTVIILDVWKGVGFSLSFTWWLCGMSPRIFMRPRRSTVLARVKSFFSITLPLISPTTLFLTIQAVIGSLQVFDQAYVLTKGGPGDSSSTWCSISGRTLSRRWIWDMEPPWLFCCLFSS